MQDHDPGTPASKTPIAHGQTVADETVHVLRPDGRTAVSFRLPLKTPPPPQMTVEADLRAENGLPTSLGDVGELADGPGVWEAIDENKVD